MNRFKVKIERIDLVIFKVKQIHYKRIEVFIIKFNPKSIATFSSNLLSQPRASFESTDSFFSFDLHLRKPPCLWLWVPTQRFQITFNNDIDTATMFYQQMIVV